MTAPLAVAVALVVALAAVGVLRARAHRLPHARPGERMLHARPVPRAGGLAILAGALPAAWIDPPGLPGAGGVWLAAVAAVAAVSFADDVRGVPVLPRLAVHLGAAVAVAWLAFGAAPAAVLAALAIAWGANLYNFMDGSDGLAGAMAVSGFAAYAVVAAGHGAPWGVHGALAAAALAFLAVNRPPASMFMGDVGAVPLGFLAAALGVAGVALGTWEAWFPLLAFLPFLADATVTLARRALRGERVWTPHRSHFYQRLNLAGAGHRGTLALYAAAMLACGSLAAVCAIARPDAGWMALAVATVFHLSGFAAIVYHERHNVRGTR